MSSGAGTNLKVGDVHAFLTVPPPLFGSSCSISRFGELFRDGQHSLVSLLFVDLLLTVSPAPAMCKRGGGGVPPCPMESTPLPTCRLLITF